HEWLADGIEHPAGEEEHLGLVASTEGEHYEGVVAGAGHTVALAHGGGDPVTHPGQHHVPGAGPQRGVHEPKAVEVNVDDRHEPTPRPAQRLVEAVEQQD